MQQGACLQVESVRETWEAEGTWGGGQSRGEEGRHSRERGNFTAGLLLTQSGWKCCRFVEQIEMVSVREQSSELNDEVGVCVCACVCEVGLRGLKFNNNPAKIKPRLSDTCQSECNRWSRPQSAIYCSNVHTLVHVQMPLCVCYSEVKAMCCVCAWRSLFNLGNRKRGSIMGWMRMVWSSGLSSTSAVNSCGSRVSSQSH